MTGWTYLCFVSSIIKKRILLNPRRNKYPNIIRAEGVNFIIFFV
jgi:hypothetical protein